MDKSRVETESELGVRASPSSVRRPLHPSACLSTHLFRRLPRLGGRALVSLQQLLNLGALRRFKGTHTI